MKRIENGTSTNADLFISFLTAPAGSGSVNRMSTMIGWPAILIHRLNATNGKSDQRIETKQYKKKTVSQPLFRIISEMLTFRVLSTHRPAEINAKNTTAS